MRNIKIYLTFALLAFLFVSCNSDDDYTLIEIEPPTVEEFSAIREKSTNDLLQTTTFKAEEGITFTSSNGTIVKIEKERLFIDGKPITGDAQLEFIEIYDRGGMLITNKPSMGYSIGTNLEPLNTVGMFYVNVKQGDKDAAIASYEVIASAENAGEMSLNMKLWKGNLSDKENFKWDVLTNNVTANSNPKTYAFHAGFSGWTSIAEKTKSTAEKTNISVRLPQGYDSKNSAVYIAYKENPNMLAYLNSSNIETGLFTTDYAWGPIGQEIYVIFTSVSMNKNTYTIKEATLEKNGTITIAQEEMERIPSINLRAMVSKLP